MLKNLSDCKKSKIFSIVSNFFEQKTAPGVFLTFKNNFVFSSTESKNSEDLKITDAGDNLKCMIGEQKIVHKRFQNGALVELTVHQKLNTMY